MSSWSPGGDGTETVANSAVQPVSWQKSSVQPRPEQQRSLTALCLAALGMATSDQKELAESCGRAFDAGDAKGALELLATVQRENGGLPARREEESLQLCHARLPLPAPEKNPTRSVAL